MNKSEEKIDIIKKAISYQKKEINDLNIIKDKLENELQIFNDKYKEILGDLLNKLESVDDTSEEDDIICDIDTTSINDRDISKEEREKLKINYKKAAQLCHPDKVDIKHSSAAVTLFKRLNSCYKDSKVEEVIAIHDFLKKGLGYNFCIENIDDIKYLKYRHNINEEQINYLKDSISSIKESESYNIINNHDVGDYFSKIKKDLEEEYKTLPSFKESSKTKKTTNSNEDSDFTSPKEKTHTDKECNESPAYDVKTFHGDYLSNNNNILLSVACFLGDLHVEKDNLPFKSFIFRKGILYITRKNIVFHKKDFLSFGLRNEINIENIVSVSSKRSLLRNIITFQVPSNPLQVEVYSSEHANSIIKLVNELIPA